MQTYIATYLSLQMPASKFGNKHLVLKRSGGKGTSISLEIDQPTSNFGNQSRIELLKDKRELSRGEALLGRVRISWEGEAPAELA